MAPGGTRAARLRLAAVVGGAIAAKPLSVQFAGPQRIEGDNSTTNYSNDLLGFVSPAPNRSSQHSAEQVRQFAGGNAAYLGMPILLVLLALSANVSCLSC